MKNSMIFLVCMLCAIVNAQAQQKFNVQNRTKTEFYDDLETAVQKAVSGDTIYLPGRVIQVENDVIIDKKLAIIGAGCDVDSIGGLQTTEIKKGTGYATINFRNGSNCSLLTGCIVGTIQFGHNNEYNEPQQNIQNVTIWRNKINNDSYLGVSVTNNQVKQIIVSENILRGSIFANRASECIINNNLVASYINSLKDSRIYNNVSSVNSLEGCTVENNFIRNLSMGSNSSYNNNAFGGNYTFSSGSNNGSNNLMGQTTQQTFEVNDLNYPKNLKIRDTSPCKNAGTDGTDIGIFGGPAPYKAGAVPFNPHITRSAISAQTDKDGKIKVDIQVSAQTR